MASPHGFLKSSNEARSEGPFGGEIDPGKYEAAVVLFDGKHPSICEDDDGNPQVFVSDGERGLDGTIGFDIPFTPDCRRATLLVTHTDPNSAALPGVFSLGAAINSMEVHLPPDDTVIPPGEPWPWHGGSVATGFTPSEAPLICYDDETTFSSFASAPGGTRYAGLWVPAGQSVTFDVSGEILPSKYFINGRGEYYYDVRVLAGSEVLYDAWNYAGVGVLPWPSTWHSFAQKRIGTWTNNTGTNQVFLIELEARRSFAGAATRWNIHVTGGAGSGAPGCG
jgi:hypothetical protein